jgi:hypothetical protein
MVGNTLRGIVMGLLVLTAQTLGCSEDDEEEARSTWSCEAIAAFSACDDFTADAETLTDEQEFCGEDDPYFTWNDAPCPTTDLIGCCYSEFDGVEYRACYYTGYPDTVAQLEQYCIDFDSEWRVGSR